MTKTATLTLQQWGNSLAVRIPTAIARLMIGWCGGWVPGCQCSRASLLLARPDFRLHFWRQRCQAYSLIVITEYLGSALILLSENGKGCNSFFEYKVV